jgi:hypothetical protein
MNMRNLFAKIMGFVIVIVTLALAPTIQSSNTTIEGLNITDLTGLSAVAAFGAPLIILGLLFSGGMFAAAGLRGRMQGASLGDMLSVIGSVVVVIVALTLFQSVVTYTNALLVATPTGIGDVIFAIVPLIIYIGIVAGAAVVQVRAYRKSTRGRRSKSYA